MQNLCARAHVHKAQAQGAGSLSGGQTRLLKFKCQYEGTRSTGRQSAIQTLLLPESTRRARFLASLRSDR